MHTTWVFLLPVLYKRWVLFLYKASQKVYNTPMTTALKRANLRARRTGGHPQANPRTQNADGKATNCH